jgi:hypothetical protein
MNEEKTTKLGITVQQEPSNTDPTHDTQSQANPVKRVVSVGRSPEEKKIPLGTKSEQTNVYS